MKTKVVPIIFKKAKIEDFERIMTALEEIYADEVEFLSPIKVGEVLPEEAEAVIIPVMWTDVYEEIEIMKATIHIPIVVVTTIDGVSLMFDWESVAYMKSKGLEVYNPHSVDLGKTVFRAIGLKRYMQGKKFLMFYDEPEKGIVPEQFGIFYWWNQEFKDDVRKKFGIEIVQKSYKNLGEIAESISDKEAQSKLEGLSIGEICIANESLLSSIKLFLAIEQVILEEGDVVGCGTNCLNEYYFSNTTPCLVWSLLYEKYGLIWSCESDTSSLLTKYILEKTIDAPIFMTNIYPFLSGMPALRHERIQEFPDVEHAENHALLVHCGYLGCIPNCMAKKWKLVQTPFVYSLGEKAVAIDAEIDTGDVTLCKLHPMLNEILCKKAMLKEYVQYPGSDCRNGGLIEMEDGYKLMENISSHHIVVLQGKRSNQLKAIGEILEINVNYCK